jgi:hypothetical protein
MLPSDAPFPRHVPRAYLAPGTPEYAWRTLEHIKRLSMAAEFSLRDLDTAIAEAREARINEQWPPDPSARFATVEELVEHAVGEKVAVIRERKRLEGHGGDRRSEGLQADIVSLKGGNQREYLLARLERDGQTDLLARIERGDLSAHRAAIEAGYVKPTMTVPADPVAMARALRRRLTPAQITELMAALGEPADPGTTPA